MSINFVRKFPIPPGHFICWKSLSDRVRNSEKLQPPELRGGNRLHRRIRCPPSEFRNQFIESNLRNVYMHSFRVGVSGMDDQYNRKAAFRVNPIRSGIFFMRPRATCYQSAIPCDKNNESVGFREMKFFGHLLDAL